MRLFSYNIICLCLLILCCKQAIGSVKTIRQLGDIGQIALPIAAVLSTEIHQDKIGFFEFVKAFTTTMGLTYILKPTVNRIRPDGGKWSFPSGHSAAAFAGATFMQRRYGWNYGVPAYLAASFVGASRIIAKRHWASDVLFGAVIGIGANVIFTKPYYNSIKVSPYIDSDTKGLMLQANF
ncbi:MAG: hypothetical protein AMJ43_06070 [Coxiella sp. DG_40]|nr:MAG: hypothetical protein AMJ43_06070 [Coxiella sp. DG_40]